MIGCTSEILPTKALFAALRTWLRSGVFSGLNRRAATVAGLAEAARVIVTCIGVADS